MRKTDKFDEGPIILDIFNALSLPGYGEDELRFQFEGADWLFKKIPCSPLDLYILDPEFPVTLHYFRPEQTLYLKGYKLIEYKKPSTEENESRVYDKNGLLVHDVKSYLFETDAPSRLVKAITDWGYFLKEQVILKKTLYPQDNHWNIKKFLLDRSDRVIERVSYCQSQHSARKDHPLKLDILYKMQVMEELSYKYDDKSRICEIVGKDTFNPAGSKRTVYIYGEHEGFIRRQTYTADTLLDEEEIIMPLNEKQIKYDFRFRIIEFDEADLQP